MNKAIKQIIHYGLQKNLLDQYNVDYAINKLLDLFDLHEYVDEDMDLVEVDEPSSILKPLLDYAVSIKKILPDTTTNRDLFEARIMDALMDRPSCVNRIFTELKEQDPKKATDYYYNLSKHSNYIKTSRTSKNVLWKAQTPYGDFDITINLSKPEKDPRDIIAQKQLKASSYPKCLLCKEHVGYSGRPGRSNHRIIPLNLNDEAFYLQYSPYVYYNEHCIVLHQDHIPMNVTINTFKRLFDFVDQFPHYFLGSNAGLPIVGGSILSHEHYQGGSHHFPIEDAKVLEEYKVKDVKISKLYWPLSVIRLESTNKDQIIDFASKLFTYFESYSNEEEGIIAKTNHPHNAITPITRKKGDTYQLDVALRNNRTSRDFPLGIFHPHPENHNIKKENIGLIEVMGLAVLPSRLVDELQEIKDHLQKDTPLPKDSVHLDWVQELKTIYKNQDLDSFIEEQVALKFTKCLENAGIFKQNTKSQKAFSDLIQGFIDVL